MNWVIIGSGNGLSPEPTDSKLFTSLWVPGTHGHDPYGSQYTVRCQGIKKPSDDQVTVPYIPQASSWLTLYSGITRYILWLLMPWLLASPVQWQSWYLIYMINRSFSSTGKTFQVPVPSQCWEIIVNGNTFHVSSSKKSAWQGLIDRHICFQHVCPENISRNYTCVLFISSHPL